MYSRFASLRQLAVIFILTALAPVAAQSEEKQPEADSADTAGWTAIVRNSPYWVSQGVYTNILTIRRWVLKESGYCSNTDRHILFDMRGQFLGWISNGTTSAATQQRLNDARQAQHEKGVTEEWIAGDANTNGYPFALACDQPHVNLDLAVGRYLGARGKDRVWGAWDDLSFATRENPGSLHDALMYIVQLRSEQNRYTLPAVLPRYLAGQILIESGGQARAHSRADAKGILQLSPSALNDCQIKPQNYWHRLAQIDCALRLMHQNARNLQPAFNERFGHLPEDKRNELFVLLLVQAYHGGAARVQALLDDETLAKPAEYFAANHERFTAGDIAFGMVFHNLGRDRLGLASLYYVADVQLATEALCRTPTLESEEFCAWK
ncbi:transglycosylase SLT domain-containing protein [Marinobacter sediminicola]|uniref:transglycosylase SLT domain-containing protein n=1 Tax=Marinobacter sediminicola TaxID=3072994 RepID=UPI002625F75D|nr:transglycosylase SLT domain-containing protein [Marinobacter sp. F26243]